MNNYEYGGGIENENAEMVMNNNNQIKHHTEELEKIVTPETEVPAWVVSKVGRSASDLSDATHYLDGVSKIKYADGGEVKDYVVMGSVSTNKFSENFSKIIPNYSEYEAIQRVKNATKHIYAKKFKVKESELKWNLSARERGKYAEDEYADGGGVGFKVGDFVKKKGSNLSLKVLEISHNKNDGKNYITIYNDVLDSTQTVNNISDYELVKYAKGSTIKGANTYTNRYLLPLHHKRNSNRLFHKKMEDADIDELEYHNKSEEFMDEYAKNVSSIKGLEIEDKYFEKFKSLGFPLQVSLDADFTPPNKDFPKGAVYYRYLDSGSSLLDGDDLMKCKTKEDALEKSYTWDTSNNLAKGGGVGGVKEGQIYHIDSYNVKQYEGERVVDDVTILETPIGKTMVLVHSQKLGADVLVPIRELFKKYADGGVGEFDWSQLDRRLAQGKKKMQKFYASGILGSEAIIVKNLDDHTGYKKGEVVEVIAVDDDNYFTVENKKGSQWYVGEEELKIIKKGEPLKFKYDNGGMAGMSFAKFSPKKFADGGVAYNPVWAEMEAYSPYSSRSEYENKKEYDDLAFASKSFSKSAEILVKENLMNGEICICKLRKILGHEPSYPVQYVGSIKLTKCFLKPFYKI